MLIPFARFGSIEEVGSPAWDATTLHDEVERRAAELSRIGIGRRSRVAIIHSNTARFFADLFAVWRVGATATCLDGGLTAAELRTIVSFVKASAVLFDSVPPPSDIGAAAVRLADNSVAKGARLPHDSDLDDPALILFTSGTTGAPKGVVLTFRAILARISLNAATIGRAVLARTLVTLPTHFGHGLIGNSLTPLMSGGTIVLRPVGIQFAQNLGSIIDQHRITFLSSVPTLWRMALKLGVPPTGSTLERVHVGSAPLSLRLWKEIAEWSRAEVVNCYGITETANWIAGTSPRLDGFVEGLVGRPWGGTAAVLDETGTIRMVGEGEIVVQTPSLMRGYLDRPDLTADAVTDGWYRTGDFGRVDEHGRILLTGRIKDEINRAGIKVQPAEIDALLETHPAVAEACTFGMNDEVSGEIVAAAIKLEPGAGETAESLQAWCRNRLRRVAIPDRWFMVDTIPRNARGKVSRDDVRRALSTDVAISTATPVHSIGTAGPTAAGLPVREPNEERIRRAVEEAWSQVFHAASVDGHQRWDEAGGDSLKALHLWFLLESALGVRLPLDILDEDSTPNKLIDLLRKSLGAAARTDASTTVPSVFFMPPAEGDTLAEARFRAAFDHRIRFELIDYPSYDRMIARGGRFDAVVNFAIEQILKTCGEKEPCLLAGYSFGGFVALEVARTLIQQGRRVVFLGLIDSQLERPDRLTIRAVRLLATKQGRARLAKVCMRLVLALLVLARAFPLVRAAYSMAGLLPSSAAFRLRFRLNQQLRAGSLAGWRPEPFDFPTTLFRSEHFSSDMPDFGWRTVCSRLVVVPISGNHDTMLRSPNREILCARFVDAVHEALDSAPPCPAIATTREAPSRAASELERMNAGR
jgi:acyl-coenzyme A synthetase/AMP-(fatty) acid ligase/thioesterase domain-containing protein/acyl carrier protein